MAIALSALAFTSCSKDNTITPEQQKEKKPEDDKKKPEDEKEKQPETKHAAITVQEEIMTNYDKWFYIDLEKGDTAIRKDYREWQYREYSDDGDQKDNFGKYKVARTIPAREANEPKAWHLAFHLYEPMTNDAEVMIAGKDTTSIDQITQLPSRGTWVKDKKVWLVADMSGMGSAPTMMGYSAGYANPALYKWHRREGMGKYALNGHPIFIVKFKDGSFAAIKFTDLTDKSGKMKQVNFDYKFFKKK